MAIGVKVTLMVQLELGATEPPQVFVSAKSPVVVMLRVSVPVPVLVKMTGCDALVTPTFGFPNIRLVTERFTVGSKPPGFSFAMYRGSFVDAKRHSGFKPRFFIFYILFVHI